MPVKSDSEKNLKIMNRIEELRKQKNMRVSEFSSLMGVQPSYVANWRKRGFPTDRLGRAAEILGTSTDMLLGRTDNSPVPEGALPVILNGSIPVIGCAKLGDDGYFADVFADPDYTQGTLNINSRDPMAYAIRCVGNSMIPRIQPGEFVIAEPSVEAVPGDEVVVVDSDGRRMVKRFLYHRDGCFHLASINSDYQPVVLEDETVKSIHPVLAIVPKKFWHPA